VVSFQKREKLIDLSGDPWNGRTLEWLTASPPAPYNFAVLPQVKGLDAFYDMKAQGIAYRKPERYVDIVMPKNTGAGVVLAGFAFVFGFAVVWHIWWLAIVSGLVMAGVVIVRASDDEAEYVLPASEVERIEQARYEALAPPPRLVSADAGALAPQPLPG